MGFREDLTKAMNLVVEKKAGYVARDVEQVVFEAATSKARDVLEWVSQQMGRDDAPPQLGVTWAPLSSNYRQRKSRLGLGESYFLYDGFLRNELAQMGGLTDSVDQAFGPVKVKLSSSGRLGVTGYFIEVTPFSNLAGDEDDQDLVERIAALSTDEPRVYGALLNYGRPGGPLRPFLLPAIAYFTRDLIREAVYDALRQHGFEVR